MVRKWHGRGRTASNASVMDRRRSRLKIRVRDDVKLSQFLFCLQRSNSLSLRQSMLYLSLLLHAHVIRQRTWNFGDVICYSSGNGYGWFEICYWRASFIATVTFLFDDDEVAGDSQILRVGWITRMGILAYYLCTLFISSLTTYCGRLWTLRYLSESFTVH